MAKLENKMDITGEGPIVMNIFVTQFCKTEIIHTFHNVNGINKNKLRYHVK
jgi:hypothetical protein